jgi:hypothetical protein
MAGGMIKGIAYFGIDAESSEGCTATANARRTPAVHGTARPAAVTLKNCRLLIIRASLLLDC